MGDILKITKRGKFADVNPGFPIISVLEGQSFEIPHPKITEFQLKNILLEGHGVLSSAEGVTRPASSEPEPPSELSSEPEAPVISLDGNSETVDAFKARLERIAEALVEKPAVNEKLAMIGLELGVSIHKGKKVEDNIQILVEKFKEKHNV